MHTPETTATAQPKRFQCRHILADGHQCGSVCLRNEKFCYFHHTSRLPIRDARQRHSRRSTFDLPLVEDRASIQVAIADILRRIASNQLDPRRAGLLLYGLQIASVNLPKVIAINTPNLQPTVEEIIEDPTLGTLAPETEYSETGAGKPALSLEAILEKQWQKDKELYRTHHDPKPATLPEPLGPITLQATAAPPHKEPSQKPALPSTRAVRPKGPSSRPKPGSFISRSSRSDPRLAPLPLLALTITSGRRQNHFSLRKRPEPGKAHNLHQAQGSKQKGVRHEQPTNALVPASRLPGRPREQPRQSPERLRALPPRRRQPGARRPRPRPSAHR